VLSDHRGVLVAADTDEEGLVLRGQSGQRARVGELAGTEVSVGVENRYEQVFSGSDPSDRVVTFSSLDQPHGDELTWVQVRLDGDGLTAVCAAELLDGDEGLDVDSERPVNGGTTSDALRLSHLLIQLGSGPLWEGSRRWRSLGGELTVELVVDRTGHVDVEFRLAPRPWEPTWAASAVIRYTLGDLTAVGRALEGWVDTQMRD
jgi:hypothetical protein